MINVCIGFDQKEAIAYHVLAHSIMRRASGPVCITPIYLPQLQNANIYTRDRDPLQSTDFTYSRFLTPWLVGHGARGGRSIFLDSDMLCLADIYELDAIATRNGCVDVNVVQHAYTPMPGTKFLNQQQTTYPCKNWSSLMVFNGFRTAVQNLTPKFVNSAPAMDLHQFKWCREGGVGSLPHEWNHLVGEYLPNMQARLVHFTLGGPWFPEYKDCEYADAWREELARATFALK